MSLAIETRGLTRSFGDASAVDGLDLEVEAGTFLGSLLEKRVTIFLTSHILEIVEKLCAEVAIIHRGALVAQGSVEELRRGAGTGEATLEELFLSLVEEVGEPKRSLSWLE